MVPNLSVLQKHQILVNPESFIGNIQQSFDGKSSSIASSFKVGEMSTKNGSNFHTPESIVGGRKIQAMIVKNVT